MPLNPALFLDRAYLLPLAEFPDVDSGTIEQLPPSGDPLVCATAFTLRTRTVFAGDQEVGVSTVKFLFISDPGATKGDALWWQGRLARVITGPLLSGGPGTPYLLYAEVRD